MKNTYFRSEFEGRTMMAWIAPSHKNDFHVYAAGYFQAGQMVYDNLQKANGYSNYIVFPLIYLFRQGIELELKHLSQVLGFIIEEKNEYKKTHALLENWKIVYKYLRNTSEEGSDDGVFNTIDLLIKEFSEIDPAGMRFRYPCDTENKPYFEDTSYVDMDGFMERMKVLVGFLEAISLGSSIMMDEKLEQMYLEREGSEEVWDEE